jgi:hypothetical protein
MEDGAECVRLGRRRCLMASSADGNGGPNEYCETPCWGGGGGGGARSMGRKLGRDTTAKYVAAFARRTLAGKVWAPLGPGFSCIHW